MAGNVLVAERTTAILRVDNLLQEWQSGGMKDAKVIIYITYI
jgi:hypothetical protein